MWKKGGQPGKSGEKGGEVGGPEVEGLCCSWQHSEFLVNKGKHARTNILNDTSPTRSYKKFNNQKQYRFDEDGNINRLHILITFDFH